MKIQRIYILLLLLLLPLAHLQAQGFWSDYVVNLGVSGTVTGSGILSSGANGPYIDLVTYQQCGDQAEIVIEVIVSGADAQANAQNFIDQGGYSFTVICDNSTETSDCVLKFTIRILQQNTQIIIYPDGSRHISITYTTLAEASDTHKQPCGSSSILVGDFNDWPGFELNGGDDDDEDHKVGYYATPALTSKTMLHERTEDLTACPSPFRDKLTAKYVGGMEGLVTYRLLDLQGRVIAETQAESGVSAIMYLDPQPAGVYLLEVISAEGRRVVTKVMSAGN